MIKKKTVFVLGAGASMPYGFPSGKQLRERICEQADDASSPLVRALKSELAISSAQVAEFGRAFQRSNQPSIDAFLARRADLVQIGKYCIAHEIGHREHPESIHAIGNEDDWYQALWHAMTVDLNGHGFLRHNKVRFVTFNYDRSLECMLHESAKHTFGLNDEEAYGAWGSIPIEHVYGSLGKFPLLNGDGRDYTKETGSRLLQMGAEGIRIIPEARMDDQVFQKVRPWFEWAEKVCFLGFGFDALNMERLDFNGVMVWVAENKPNAFRPEVSASAYGLTDEEIKRNVLPRFSDAGGRTVLATKNLMLLRQASVLD